jgi:hypothetical protein
MFTARRRAIGYSDLGVVHDFSGVARVLHATYEKRPIPDAAYARGNASSRPPLAKNCLVLVPDEVIVRKFLLVIGKSSCWVVQFLSNTTARQDTALFARPP